MLSILDNTAEVQIEFKFKSSLFQSSCFLLYTRSWEIFSMRSQVPNILGFVGHLVSVTVKASQVLLVVKNSPDKQKM